MDEMSGRYLLFLWEDPEPEGGWCDFKGAFPSPEAALCAVCDTGGIHRGYYHVVDSRTRQIVEPDPGIAALVRAARAASDAQIEASNRLRAALADVRRANGEL